MIYLFKVNGVCEVKELIKNLKFTWKYVKYQKKSLIKFTFTELISIIISIVVPILSARAIIFLTDNSFNQLVLVAIAIFLIENARNLVHYFGDKYTQTMYRETLIRLQCDLGANMLMLDNNTLDKNSSGVFIQRLTSDTARLSDVFSQLTTVIADIVTDLGIFVALFIVNKLVFAFMIIELIILYVIEGKRTQKRNENDKIYRKENERVTSFIGEMVRGVRDVKMLNSENSFLKVLRERIYTQNHARYVMSDANRKYRLIGGFTRDLCDLLLIILLVVLIKNKYLAVASALIVHNYSGRVPSLIYFVGRLMEVIKDFNLSSSRVSDIINSDEFEKEKFGTVHLDKVNGDFEFKKVKFSYNNKDTRK